MPRANRRIRADPRVPIGRAEDPEQVGGEGVGRPFQLAVLFPVLGIAVMGEMLDLVEIPRIQKDEAEQPTESLVEPTGPEHGRMAQFVLSGIKKVDQNAVHDENRDGEPPGAPACPKERAAHGNRAEMACCLDKAMQVGLGCQPLQFERFDHVPANKNFIHCHPLQCVRGSIEAASSLFSHPVQPKSRSEGPS